MNLNRYLVVFRPFPDSDVTAEKYIDAESEEDARQSFEKRFPRFTVTTITLK